MRSWLIAALLLAGCARSDKPLIAGDPENGRLLLRQYGCGACHRIPGVATADGNVGPPLRYAGISVYIAGVLPNTPANMAYWIRSPQRVDPLTAMPDLKVSEAHAIDMTAYLYTLDGR
ncbi:MAG: c-type cytochrome [Burkholderiaceae bacterium]